jgi:hypothetical protein
VNREEKSDVERGLGRLASLTPPPGLRERVLESALEARKNAALTPRLRTTAAVCMILIAALLGLDPLFGRHEAASMAALFDGRSSKQPAGEEAPELTEVLAGQEAETTRMARLQVMAASAVQKKLESDFTEARKRLKGWLENETSEDPY